MSCEKNYLTDLTHRVESCFDENEMLRFLWSIEGIPIDPTRINGNVLVIGPGYVFPERVLLCTPESLFRTPHSDISTITLCDEDYLALPSDSFSTWNIKVGSYPYTPDETHTIPFYLAYARDMLQDIPESTFDVVLFFRQPFFARHLMNDGNLAEIHRTLRKGGYFLGSGCMKHTLFTSIGEDKERFREFCNEIGMTVDSLTQLYDFDQSSYVYKDNHGVTATKV